MFKIAKIRKDTKNRILRTGESQDKAGRYWYKWNDLTGKRRAVSSWRLTQADAVPPGKRDCRPLREMIKQIETDQSKRITYNSITVNELLENHINSLRMVREQTIKGYRIKAGLVKQSRFGKIKITDFKTSTAKAFDSWLLDDKGLKRSTVSGYHGLMHSAFDDAVQDDLIAKNPFCFGVSSMCEQDAKTREALTPEQESALLDFVENHNIYKIYYDAIYILLNTGLRISEFCGVTKDDIDFKNSILHVNKQLISNYGDSSGPQIGPTKSKSGKRDIPLTPETLARIKHCYSGIGHTAEIDGYRNFLYYTKDGNPMRSPVWTNRLHSIVKAYNKSHEEPLPDITPHILRHTFCSKMFKAGCSLKTIQAIMGHSDVNLSLNTYTHVKNDSEYIRQDFEKMIL